MIKKTVVLLSLLLSIVTCGTFGLYTYLHYSIIPKCQQKLLVMANDHAHEISTFLNEQEKHALKLSQEPIILTALTTPIPAATQAPATTTADNNPTPPTDSHQAIATLVATHKETAAFKNIILVDKDGNIIFSTTKKDILGININQPIYTRASFGKSYERASMTITNDFSSFNFNDLIQEPALFITIPILKEKKFIGALGYQLDQEKIYLITNQYIGLEKTGEVVLATKEDTNIIFLSPTRNDPDLAFKKRALFTDQPLAIQPSVLGQEGVGKATDYRGKRVLGAWKFIPKLDWGMIVKIDLNEILQPANTLYKLFIFFLLIFLLSLLINIYLFYPLIRQKLKAINNTPFCKKIPPLLKNPLFILLLIFCGLTIKNIIQCNIEQSSVIETAKTKAIENISKNADVIETMLEKIVFIGQSIADDLRTHYLAKDDIATRIKRDLTENSIITEITVLFAPYTYDSTTQLHVDSTLPQQDAKGTFDESLFKTKWYTQAIEKGATWIVNPTKEGHNARPTATYACTFFDKEKKPNGVVAITYSLDPIINTTQYSGIGQTGYSIIMADNGAFIFHPTNALVQTETTLVQYAQSKGNEELAAIGETVTDGKAHMNAYLSEATKEHIWIYTHPIKVSNWTIGYIFPQDEIGLASETIRHYYFWILIWATITLLLIFALLLHYSLFSLTYYTIIANIILIMALLSSWHIIQETTTINRESRTIITDQSNLNKFLNDLNDEAQRKHESAPINIPCGILISSLSTSGGDSITISGYIWNKYNTLLHKNISRGMELPQATRMIFGKPLTVESDNGEETVTWNIQGVMFQEQNYELYPFDQEQIRIILEHKDIEKNIILTPDLLAYKKISPESKPGLDKEFTFAGFTIEQTFFEYHKIDPSTNFGFKDYGKVTSDYQLVYNAIMNRNLSNPFILYLLPLLLILFSLFTTLLIAKKHTEPLSVLAGYTGLFFAMIVLQRSLREAHPSGATLYMEYAFFFTYITIILLIMHTILMYYYKNWQTYQERSLYAMRILFWPFQFISWLITTLIVFY